MAYYKGKDIEKSRGNAMKELILEKRKVFRWQHAKWDIHTLSSIPKTHPNALNNDVIAAIMCIRRQKFECAEIIQYKLKKKV